jgi:hypothetical protein
VASGNSPVRPDREHAFAPTDRPAVSAVHLEGAGAVADAVPSDRLGEHPGDDLASLLVLAEDGDLRSRGGDEPDGPGAAIAAAVRGRVRRWRRIGWIRRRVARHTRVDRDHGIAPRARIGRMEIHPRLGTASGSQQHDDERSDHRGGLGEPSW